MHRTLLSLCLLAFAALPAAAAQQPAPHDTLVGAVRAVDVRSRTLEVTVGVGLALRALHLQVPADTRITAAGDTLRFDLLMPGDVVRVSFGSRPAGLVAYTIERLGDMHSGRERSP